MSHWNRTQPRLWRLIAFSVAAGLLAALPTPRTRERVPARPRIAAARPRRRFATSLAFAMLFFAGGALSAVAGDQGAAIIEESACDAAPTVTVEETAALAEPCVSEGAASAQPLGEPEAPPAEAPVAPDPTAPEPTATVPTGETAVEAPPAEPVAPDEPAAPDAIAQTDAVAIDEAPATSEPAAAAPEPRPSKRARAVVRRPTAVERATVAVDPEVEEPGSLATVWLHRALPDPTPPSLRLSRDFARRLVAASERNLVPWSLVLGVARARGDDHAELPTPRAIAITAARLREVGVRSVKWRAALAKRDRRAKEEQVLTDAWNAALAATGRTTHADRAIALAHYYRAVGLPALVRGLRAQEEAIARRVLADPRVDVYDGGRDDIAAGRIDVRITALIAYLADTFGHVTVSSLKSGHRLYARPGVVSAHVYGHAVDVAALADTPVAGNQEPGGLTEKAVRAVLLLPAEMLPRQVISLLGLGGPSFPLGDHGDHIHVGF